MINWVYFYTPRLALTFWNWAVDFIIFWTVLKVIIFFYLQWNRIFWDFRNIFQSQGSTRDFQIFTFARFWTIGVGRKDLWEQKNPFYEEFHGFQSVFSRIFVISSRSSSLYLFNFYLLGFLIFYLSYFGFILAVWDLTPFWLYSLRQFNVLPPWRTLPAAIGKI